MEEKKNRNSCCSLGAVKAQTIFVPFAIEPTNEKEKVT